MSHEFQPGPPLVIEKSRWVGLCFAVALGAIAFGTAMIVHGVAVFAIGWLTHSSPIGICGPVGSDGPIYTMLALLALSPFVSGWAGVFFGRRAYRKWKTGHVPNQGL